jgi:PAS domain S-box-containing protein
VQELAHSHALGDLFETIVSQADEAVVIIDGGLDSESGPIIEYMNAAAERRTGYSNEQLVGQPFRRLVLPDIWPSVLTQLSEVRKTGKTTQIEVRAKDTTGREYWVEVSATPIFGDDGNIQHFVRLARDITARKHAEQQREITQRLLASVFGAMELALVVANPAGRVIMANAALGRQLGWGVFDAIDQHVSCFVAESSRTKLKIAFDSGTDQVRRIEANLLHRSGRSVPGVLQLTIVKSPSDQDFYLVKFELAAETTRTDSLHASVAAALSKDGGPTHVVAGKLQLVGMAALREELGEKWADVQERAFGIAHRVITKHLRSEDVCKRSSNDGFVVFFHDLPEPAAQAKAYVIGEEIREKLLAEIPELSQPQVSSFAARVAINSAEAETEESLLDVLSSRLDKERQQHEKSAHETIKAELRGARVVLQSAETMDRKQVPILIARLPARLRSSLALMQSRLMLVPLKYSTAARSKDFEIWLKTARTLGDVGKSQIVIEITGAPPTVLRSKLADIAMRLAPLFRATAFELTSSDSAFAAGLPMSTRLATIAVHRLMDRGRISPEAVIRLTKLLDARQCKLIARDCTSPEQIPTLAAAGIQLAFAAEASEL